MSAVVGNQSRRLVVCRAMTTPRPLLPLAGLALIVLTACSSGGDPAISPSAPPSPGPSQNAVDLPTTAPGGGGSSGSSGSGVVEPVPTGGAIDPNDPTLGGGAKLVIPRPGQANPHPVAPIKLEASVDGRHVLVKVAWYSGIEPCSVLDSVRVERAAGEIAITPLEGIGDPTAVCIDIAQLKATIVDLGELEPGAWRITAPGGSAAPLELTIS
jgi:hypothetical protein